MSDPYIGEIRMWPANFAPVGWALCDGSLLPISSYDVLFNLIGTTYGGDGQNTFGLPDLRGRAPIHQGPGFVLGQIAGVESVTLTTSQMPQHTHLPVASNNGPSNPVNSPANATWSSWTGGQYNTPSPSPNTTMSPAALGSAGSSQPHDNMVPFLVINFIIALEGIYPSQT